MRRKSNPPFILSFMKFVADWLHRPTYRLRLVGAHVQLGVCTEIKHDGQSRGNLPHLSYLAGVRSPLLQCLQVDFSRAPEVKVEVDLRAKKRAKGSRMKARVHV